MGTPKGLILSEIKWECCQGKGVGFNSPGECVGSRYQGEINTHTCGFFGAWDSGGGPWCCPRELYLEAIQIERAQWETKTGQDTPDCSGGEWKQLDRPLQERDKDQESRVRGLE